MCGALDKKDAMKAVGNYLGWHALAMKLIVVVIGLSAYHADYDYEGELVRALISCVSTKITHIKIPGLRTLPRGHNGGDIWK